MPVLTETKHAGSCIVSEEEALYSCDAITIAQSQTILANQVLGQLTAGGQFVVLAPGASDGPQNAAGIAVYPVTTGAGQTAKLAVLARACQVRDSDLAWPAGITGPQKTAAVAALAAKGIIVRT